MVTKISNIILPGVLLFLPFHAFPGDWNDLSGIYAVTAKNLIDPGKSEAPDSHYRVQLKNDSAKDLYEAMKVEPVIDECTGASAKSIGEMQCLHFKNDNAYECHFSINIAEQTIHYGVVC